MSDPRASESAFETCWLTNRRAVLIAAAVTGQVQILEAAQWGERVRLRQEVGNSPTAPYRHYVLREL